MRQLGFLLLVLGIALCVIYFMNTEVAFLNWVGNWGENVAWGIRGGLIVLGALLLSAGKSKGKSKK